MASDLEPDLNAPTAPRKPIVTDDPLWYKDAVIYQVHVRGFADSSNDGVGDFIGLTRKLDYIQSLGVSAVWLQPFYPSPLRDDGYDIAHYQEVHPSYGTRRDFVAFLNEAHSRGLRVITELVINHTSDQHPWFQAARRAKRGSSKRDFYVWSDTDTKYAGVPIVFKDTERSNWTWDPVAGQYYWHRFFHHQPDLNFDNPQVQKAVIKVMRFWLDMGVDGMRLDAVPYLVEREGTQCANLPETHRILKDIRRELDARYSNRMLLAEANQWPSDVRAYFGDDDECQMAFHFPLMPRLFMAMRQEDRHPLSEILYQMPEIPERCQWAIFLRNHDELTLEMVSDEERDYMYQTYASDPQMRINVGIRRRLAPLMENSRPRIELLTGLLLSLPGTPVLYYGDELGMGDNIYLGDRNSVRTPMQWSADRNGGFSRADPARLYAPSIMDPVYGYQSVNVESQERSPHSLLSWMKKTIALRQQHRTFGRGTMELLRPTNRRIFAFIRRWDTDDPILVVANLSRTVQAVTLDLSRVAGLIPIEMSGGVELPRITDAPYPLTLAHHGFYWLRLQREAPTAATLRAVPSLEMEPEQSPLLVGPEWWKMLDGSIRHLLEARYLIAFLKRQPWFEVRRATLSKVEIADWLAVESGEEAVFITVIAATFADGDVARYLVPLVATPADQAGAIAHETPEAIVVRLAGARQGLLHARLDGAAGRLLLRWIAAGTGLPMRRGTLQATRRPGFAALGLPDQIDALTPEPFDAEKFHSSAAFGERVMLKAVRRVWPGLSSEVELLEFLAASDLHRTPIAAGTIDYVDSTQKATVVILSGYVAHQSDGWGHALAELARFFDLALTLGNAPVAPHDMRAPALSVGPEAAYESVGSYLKTATVLGRRSAELHLALANERAIQAFGAATVDAGGAAMLSERVVGSWERCRAAVDAAAMATLSEGTRAQLADLLARHDDVVAAIQAEAVAASADLTLTRIHGSLDLAHVLLHEGDFTFIGLEDDGTHSVERRRRLSSPLEDVATMTRSFHAAAQVALGTRTAMTPPLAERLAGWTRWWTVWVSTQFLAGYREVAGGVPFAPKQEDAFVALVRLFMLEQAFFEICFSLVTRPAWVGIPLTMVGDLLPAPAAQPEDVKNPPALS
jgi:maltose alpha-D-glucosyltransferase/alpha-amylase